MNKTYKINNLCINLHLQFNMFYCILVYSRNRDIGSHRDAKKSGAVWSASRQEDTPGRKIKEKKNYRKVKSVG